MGKPKVSFKLEGFEELEKMLLEIGKEAGKVVTSASKDGANVALKAAKQNALPEQSGDLVKGIILKGEKKKGAKKVYQILMDPAMNDAFVKLSQNGKRYYYPASIEYGFLLRDGTKKEGRHFLRNAIVDNNKEIEKAVLDKLSKVIDKELKKQGKR